MSVPVCHQLPGTLSTPRLRLERLRRSDAAPLRDAIAASLPELRRWLPWALDPLPDVAEMETRIARFRADFRRGVAMTWSLRDPGDDPIIGGIGLHGRIGHGALEVGYWLRTDRTGAGLMTEAVGAVTRLGFQVGQVRWMEIQCDPDNERSLAVPRRAGYRAGVTVRGRCLGAEAEPRDTVIWTLDRARFPATPAAAVPVEIPSSPPRSLPDPTPPD